MEIISKGGEKMKTKTIFLCVFCLLKGEEFGIMHLNGEINLSGVSFHSQTPLRKQERERNLELRLFCAVNG